MPFRSVPVLLAEPGFGRILCAGAGSLPVHSFQSCKRSQHDKGEHSAHLSHLNAMPTIWYNVYLANDGKDIQFCEEKVFVSSVGFGGLFLCIFQARLALREDKTEKKSGRKASGKARGLGFFEHRTSLELLYLFSQNKKHSLCCKRNPLTTFFLHSAARWLVWSAYPLLVALRGPKSCDSIDFIGTPSVSIGLVRLSKILAGSECGCELLGSQNGLAPFLKGL